MTPELFSILAGVGTISGSTIGGFLFSKKGAHKGSSEGAAALNGAAKRLERVEEGIDKINGKMDRYALSTERRLTRLETLSGVDS